MPWCTIVNQSLVSSTSSKISPLQTRINRRDDGSVPRIFISFQPLIRKAKNPVYFCYCPALYICYIEYPMHKKMNIHQTISILLRLQLPRSLMITWSSRTTADPTASCHEKKNKSNLLFFFLYMLMMLKLV